ncbi:M4 family metallopeptidase, partial [Flavobacteriaceae bacterium]|nr:M4 family metallopeptidase [Flavobacteriaceae bacterium]
MKFYSATLMICFFVFGSVIAQQKQNDDTFKYPDVLKFNISQTGEPNSIIFKNSTQIRPSQVDMLFNEILKISKEDDMRLLSSKEDNLGFKHDKYTQYFNNIQVEFATYTIHSKNGKVTSMRGDYFNVKGVKTRPNISKTSAFNEAISHVNAKAYVWDNDLEAKALEYQKPTGELVVFPVMSNINDVPRLAFKFDIYAQDPIYRADVYIDALTGEFIFENKKIHHADVSATGQSLYNGNVSFTADNSSGPYRLRQTVDGGGIQTFDMNNGTNYGSASDITSNSTSFNSPTGVQAHFGAEQTHKYFSQQHARNSYNGNGAVIRSYVSYNNNYVNAFWDGSRMTYGDGDGVNYGPLVSVDIVGHEITHGVTEYAANLVYSYQSGALNESFSDIFGESIEKFATGTNDWLMGDDIGAGGSGGALRSMSSPNIYGDPDTYLGTNWYSGSGDNGGVHYNSGVQNFWFYLLTVGGSGTNDIGDAYSVTSIGMDKAAVIAYRNLTVYLTTNSQYSDARDGAIQSAIDLYGSGSIEEIATTNAWYAVGVGEEYVQTCALSAPVGLMASNITDNGFAIEWNNVSGAVSYTITINGSTDIVGGLSYNANGLIAGTDYNVMVQANCSPGDSGASSSISLTTTGTTPLVYCNSSSSNINDEYIGRVQLNSIDNSSGAQFYTDFTGISTTLMEGTQHTLTVTPTWTGTIYSEGYAVWIDYNKDGDFADSGELVWSQLPTQTTPVSGSFIIPESAVNGATRMRVSMKYNGVPSSCESFT